MRRWTVAALIASLVVVGACGDDDGQESGDTTTTGVSSTTTQATSSSVATSAPTQGGGGSTSPTSTPAVAGPAHLTAVRVARQDRFDRVVFEFDAGPPGYRVAYVQRPVTEDGSGREVAVEGAAVLEVRLEQASTARLSGENVVPTYTGPRRFEPTGTPTVAELVVTGDFEGVLTWTVGVQRRAPVKVSTLTGPSRVVVDLAHEG